VDFIQPSGINTKYWDKFIGLKITGFLNLFPQELEINEENDFDILRT